MVSSRFFFKIFFQDIFSRSQFKIFFQDFFQELFSRSFFKIFFQDLFSRSFFKIFFQDLFFKIFFQDLFSRSNKSSIATYADINFSIHPHIGSNSSRLKRLLIKIKQTNLYQHQVAFLSVREFISGGFAQSGGESILISAFRSRGRDFREGELQIVVARL